MKLKYLFIISFLLMLSIPGAYADIQNIEPSDDVYVSQGTPTVNWNNNYLYVRNHASLAQRTWLMFNVSSGLVITHAELYLYLNALAFPDSTVITVHGSDNSTWTEETITWNDQPDYDASAIDQETVLETEAWYSWDVTANVTSGNVTSFCMIAVTYYPNAQFYSKEYGTSYDPYLRLTVASGEGEEDTVDITVLNFPLQLGEKLGISTFSAGMLLSALLLFPFNMIFIFWKKKGIIALIFNFSILGIFFSFGWLPLWTVILVGLIVVAITSKMLKENI